MGRFPLTRKNENQVFPPFGFRMARIESPTPYANPIMPIQLMDGERQAKTRSPIRSNPHATNPFPPDPSIKRFPKREAQEEPKELESQTECHAHRVTIAPQSAQASGKSKNSAPAKTFPFLPWIPFPAIPSCGEQNATIHRFL